jgi:virginiamycin B lyase
MLRSNHADVVTLTPNPFTAISSAPLMRMQRCAGRADSATTLLKLLGVLALLLPTYLAGAAELTFSAPKITEWQLPSPMFGRTAAAGPDGMIYIAVPNDNKVARFDPRTQSFRDWEMPRAHQPTSIVVDRNGTVWTTGYGNGTIARLRPANGMIAEFSVPSAGGGPHSLVISEDGETLWFTMQTGDKLGSLDTATGRIAEYETSGNASGIALDRAGNVWWCRSTDNKLGRMEPRSGKVSEVDLGRGSRPRRIAVSADGMLWVTLYGKGQLVKVNPQTMKVVKTYPLHGGNAGAHSVAVDSAGAVWVNELKNDTVVRLDSATDAMQTIRLPSPNNGVRHLVVDALGRVWYVGSHNGKLGVID